MKRRDELFQKKDDANKRIKLCVVTPSSFTTSTPSESPFAKENHDMGMGFSNYLWLFGDLDQHEAEVTFNNSGPTPPISSDLFDDVSFSITDSTRVAILELLHLGHSEQVLTLANLNSFLELFWAHFNPIYPIIHHATFNPNQTDIYLLITMISIGMAHSLHYDVSVEINKQYRRLLFDAVGNDIKPRLTLLQALLLHNFACKYLGDSLLYEMSQLFHRTNVNFLRYTGYFDTLTEPVIDRPNNATSLDLQSQWESFIYYETCKRTAFFTFICDSQNSTLSKHQILSSFDIQLDLPCTDAVWNASDFRKFYQEYERQPNGLTAKPRPNSTFEFGPGPSMTAAKSEGKWPNFIWSLKSIMQSYRPNQKDYSLECYSQYSRYILLHGLISICWDLRWKGLLDLGIASKKRLNDLSSMLARAFIHWRDDLDLNISRSNQQTLDSISSLNNYSISPAFWANIGLFQLGLISLYADTSSIITFVSEYKIGVSTVGSPGGKYKAMQHTINQQNIESWVRSDNGMISVTQACKFLRIVLNNLDIIDSVSHVPYSIFISCCVIWCFEIKRDCSAGFRDDGDLVELSIDHYIDERSNVNFEVCKLATLEYIDLIDGNLGQEGTEETYEQYWERQKFSAAIVCCSMYLLRTCKWSYTRKFTEKLEHTVDSYNQ